MVQVQHKDNSQQKDYSSKLLDNQLKDVTSNIQQADEYTIDAE